jgi:hypothetical protein
MALAASVAFRDPLNALGATTIFIGFPPFMTSNNTLSLSLQKKSFDDTSYNYILGLLPYLKYSVILEQFRWVSLIAQN